MSASTVKTVVRPGEAILRAHRSRYGAMVTERQAIGERCSAERQADFE